jgi:hypothetical protein
MSAIEFNWKPTNRQLRQFGFISLFALPLAGWFLSGRPTPGSWENFHTLLLGGLAGAGALSAILAWTRPSLLKPFFILLSLIAFPIGLVVSEVIILAIYLFMFTPMALLFRLLGRDALQRDVDRDSTKTYWSPKRQAPDVKSYFRQS